MNQPRLPANARCFALIPCAGMGARSGAAGPKQYVRLAGKAMVSHTIEALLQVARLELLLVAVAPDDDGFESEVGLPPSDRLRVRRCGGPTRAATVANGLAELLEAGALDGDWVLVHDAARCLIRSEWVDALIDACRDDGVGGLLALPLADTLKDERDGRVGSTLSRAGKWLAQTPQMFRIGLLRRALANAGDQVTDESGAVEALGLSPRLVASSIENFKLTYPTDFDLAERLLRTRR